MAGRKQRVGGRAVGLLALGLAASLAGAGALGGRAAQAGASYPTRQITYYVCFDPGGQSDREARRQQPHLERLLGQRVLIEYRVGGGGAVCWSEFARVRPDGYTIAGINVPHIILQPMLQQTGYRTEQLVPVSFFQRTILGLAVRRESPYRTLEEFLEAARARPGEISIGGVGTFSGPHFAVVRLEQLAGVRFNYVPFTGAAPQIVALLGGHVESVFGNSDDLVRHRDNLRVLAFADAERFAAFPDTPTFRERGLDLTEAVDRGIAVPRGTPQAVMERLEAAFLEIARDPGIQAEMVSQGFVPLAMGIEESARYLQERIQLYSSVVATMRR